MPSDAPQGQHHKTSSTSPRENNVAKKEQPAEDPALISPKSNPSQTTKPETDSGDQKYIAPNGLTDVDVLVNMDDMQEDQATAHDAATMSQSSWRNRRYLAKERRLGHLKIRSDQAVVHHNFTTLRIEDLETEVQELKAHMYNLEGSIEDMNPIVNKHPIHQHQLRRSSKIDFQLTRSSVLEPARQQPALEVLLAGDSSPRSSERIPRVVPGELHTSPAPQTSDGGTPVRQPKELHYGTPERLRIRSRSLMSHLQELTAMPIENLAPWEEIDDQTVHTAVSFLRPFKFFVRYETAIRGSVETVESQIREERTKDAESSSNAGGENDKVPAPSKGWFEDTDLLQDLNLLVKFLDTDLKPTFDLRRRIRDGTAVDIEYADLWHLFNRGDFIVTRPSKDYAYMVVNVAGGRERLIDVFPENEKGSTTSTDGFIIDCLSIGFDGSSYVPKLETITIGKFHGTRPISSLSAYPLRFDPNAKELRARFLKGGRNFMDATSESFCHKIVRGTTLDEPSHDVDAQVIIDTSLAMKLNPDWRPKTAISVDELTGRDERETREAPWCRHPPQRESCCGSDVIFKDLKLDDIDTESFILRKGRMMGPLGREDFAEEDLMLMRPHVHAFVLRSRRWVTIRAVDLHEVVFENNFDDLVLPDSYKATLQALVRTHEKDRTVQPALTGGSSSIGTGLDLVKGKGSGLVILLHGPPGVGKTSTAECVSDNTRRPLYPITCGDFGETAAEVETSLQYCFQLAHKWGCVLLLDEADIFLAKRTRHDLRHNAVTSVFLRSLEYYAGILFLTTNRVGALDPAFKSRIQMALFYPALDLEVTCKLYEKFIKRAKAEQDRKNSHQFKIKEKEILKFARRHFRSLEKQHYETWNGRQIRNAFQTAIALAEHEAMTKAEGDPKPVLGKAQFETVADGSKRFDEYLVQTLGWTDADAAKREGLRDDTFMAVPVSMHSAAPLTPRRGNVLSRPGRGIPRSQAQASYQGARDSSSDEDSDSDTDTDSDDDDEDEDEERERSRGGKGAARKEAGGQSGANMTTAAAEMEEFQQFMSWKKMQKGRQLG